MFEDRKKGLIIINNLFFQEEEQLDRIEFGSKMVLLMDILKECELIGDKVTILLFCEN